MSLKSLQQSLTESVRQAGRITRWGYRRATVPRILPSFIIAGAQKAGTTTLFRNLEGHPNVVGGLTKEPHFFSRHFQQGTAWYRANFPHRLYARFRERHVSGRVITGEATPYYLDHPHAPARCFSLLPDARIIILLRNPVDRAYSHYQHTVRLGLETLPSFEEAIDEEPRRLNGERDRMLKDESYYSYAHQHLSYLSRGVYIDHVGNWLKAYPREQIQVICSEEMRANFADTFQSVLRFLHLPEAAVRSERMYEGSYGKMNPETRKRLVEFFRPRNEALYDLLERRLPWDQ